MLESQASRPMDWRSLDEKKKGLLRQAMRSAFKTWIPDHPEAREERGQVFSLYQNAILKNETVTLQSLLSTGIEDILAHEYASYPFSMQQLLVEREGTDAFLDPRNALKVVRRKFGMMTLIARMASTFEQRNMIAITLKPGFSQAEYIELGRLLSMRIEGTAAEEERSFKKSLRKSSIKHLDVLYHDELVGRRIPVPWTVKYYYSVLGRLLRKRGVDLERECQRFAEERVQDLSTKAIRELILFSEELATELDAIDNHDPIRSIFQACNEQDLLTATRNIFDEFQELRKLRAHERAVGSGLVGDLGLIGEKEEEEALLQFEENFLELEDGEEEEDDEYLRLGHALERVREIQGRAFFSRISMVSGAINFIQEAMGDEAEFRSEELAGLDPEESLRQAKEIVDPFFRARTLGEVVPKLLKLGKEKEAHGAAQESLIAARSCTVGEGDLAYTFAAQALLLVKDQKLATEAVEDALEFAHDHEHPLERVASIMRIASALLEAGRLPEELRERLPQALMGEDIHFWGREEIHSALVEICLAILSGEDPDTTLFLQKLTVHPNPEVRRSVIRAMPFSERQELRNMLLSHLKDHDPQVRIEVAERIGQRGERGLALYLINHLRHAKEVSDLEKQVFSLNLARLDTQRYLPLFNGMLGHMASRDAKLLKQQKPFKDDPGFQMAALKVLYHLNCREARRLIFKAKEQARGAFRGWSERLWSSVKNVPYGEADLPRSSHDPEWSEEDYQDLLSLLDKIAPLVLPEEHSAQAEKHQGFFARLRRRFWGGKAPEHPVEQPSTEEAEEGEVSIEQEVQEELIEISNRALLHFEANLLEGPEIWTGEARARFSLYDEESGGELLWEEEQEIYVKQGLLSADLGLKVELPQLPYVVWMGISLNARGEMSPRLRLNRLDEDLSV